MNSGPASAGESVSSGLSSEAVLFSAERGSGASSFLECGRAVTVGSGVERPGPSRAVVCEAIEARCVEWGPSRESFQKKGAGTEPASARQHLISPFLERQSGAEDGAVTKPESGKLTRQNDTNRATLCKRAAESGLIKHSHPTQRMTRSGRYFTWASRFRSSKHPAAPHHQTSNLPPVGFSGSRRCIGIHTHRR